MMVMVSRLVIWSYAVVGSLALGLGTQEVTAADGDTDNPASAQVEEIVVTAQRRSERMQDVPISVAAFTSEALERSGVETTADLQNRVAGFVVQERTGAFIPYLRGVGSVDPNPQNESIVSTYIDGVYVVAMPAGLMSLANIEQIEVLKGPQGTLFGRNSVGGVIQINTKTPTSEPQANFEVGYGNYQTVNGKAYVSGGIANNLSADLALAYQHQGQGWGRNINTGHGEGFVDYSSGRSKIYLDLPDTKATFTADFSNTSADASVMLSPYHAHQVLVNGQPFQGGFYDDAGVDPYSRVWQRGVSLKVEQNIGFAELSISAFRHTYWEYFIDQANVPQVLIDAGQTMTSKDYSQEFQLVSQKDSRISWIVGAYYLNHKNSPIQTIYSGTSTVINFNYDIKTESVAGYAQATIPIIQGTNFTAGLRYTSDDQGFDKIQTINGANIPVPRGPNSQTFDKPTWRLALDHKFTENLMVYGSYNRGFKSGVWNVTIATPSVTQPEVLDAYEMGLKSELLDRKLRLNAAVYYYDYKNIQYNLVVNGTSQIRNAAAADIQGLDLDGSLAATERLTLNFGAVWSWKRKYTSFPQGVVYIPSGTVINGKAHTCATPDCQFSGNFTGNTILLAPAISANASLDYKVPVSFGELGFTVNESYQGKIYRTVDDRLNEPGYGLLNASVRWVSTHMPVTITMWGRNLTGAEYHTFGTALNFGPVGGPGAPRTYGVTFGYKF
jgi:iron complex outermembrane receptor protein